MRTLCFLWHEIEKGWENYQSIFGSTLYKTSTACVDSTRKFSIQRCLEIMQISSVKRSIKKISIIFFYINKQFRCWSYQSCSVAYAWGAERSHSNFVTSKNVEKKKKSIKIVPRTFCQWAYRKTSFKADFLLPLKQLRALNLNHWHWLSLMLASIQIVLYYPARRIELSWVNATCLCQRLNFPNFLFSLFDAMMHCQLWEAISSFFLPQFFLSRCMRWYSSRLQCEMHLAKWS